MNPGVNNPIHHPPISAIVIFRNEKRHLQRCLEALRWCDELIAVDMESSDGSLEIAESLADRVYRVPQCPIAEPTRVAAARLARHDWVLLVDPDEQIPADLADDIRRTLAMYPNAGAISLPMWFYFKGRRLTGTVWGTLTYKLRLIHRERCELLPLCNRISRLLPGQTEVRIPHRGDNHIRHYWSDSYLDLLHKHFVRYSHTEAAAMVAQGTRFGLRMAVCNPLVELYKSLRHFDGWRIGIRGWALSAIYFGYVLASHWLTLYYQWRGAPAEKPQAHELPTLIEVTESRPRQRRAAA
ncbi:MAG: glycosyltransferase family 2 protein [Phycisphaeraceae bacterium]